jgi:hypothetical protein
MKTLIKQKQQHKEQEVQRTFDSKLDVINYSWQVFKHSSEAKPIQEVHTQIEAQNPYNELQKWKKFIQVGGEPTTSLI